MITVKCREDWSTIWTSYGALKMKETTITSFNELHTVHRSHWAEHLVYRGEDSCPVVLRKIDCENAAASGQVSYAQRTAIRKYTFLCDG